MIDKEDLINPEEEILSSVEEVSKFKANSIIWRDLKMFVSEWLSGVRTAALNPATTNNLQQLGDYQGRAYMCEMFLTLPDKIIAALEDEQYIKSLEEREAKDGTSSKEK